MGASKVRLPLAVGEAATLGRAVVRAPMVAAEATTTGTPKIRLSFAAAEATTAGKPKVRSPIQLVEVLSIVPASEPSMVSTAIFPSLPSLGWSVIRKPALSTRVSTHQSGREIRSAQMQYPVREFDLTYELLRSAADYAELQTIEGFYLSQGGRFGQFLWQDIYTPDCQVRNGAIGIGDGTTTGFKLVRVLGGFAEPVGYVFPTGLTAVYLNGTAQPASGYSLTAPNNLSFSEAPPAGAVITADFDFYFQVRFADDAIELEEFMSMLFELKELKLLQVLPL